ncbi:MAG: hypothetical protein V4548_12065 [Bacteroidota bacterium]
MKKLFVLPLLVLASCGICKSEKSFSEIQSPCPEDGKCTIEIMTNKKLDIKTDEFGSNYYQLLDSPKTGVVHYKYKRNTKKGLQDGSYIEEVFFEINQEEKSLLLTNADLQKTKMIYGRICYCKGQTGYYKISEGNLKLNRKNHKIEIDLDFKNNKVPQIIQKITAVIK